MPKTAPSPEPYDPRMGTQTVFKAQLAICVALGSLLFLTFCTLRYHFPILYTIRPLRNKKIKMLPDSFFSWIKVVSAISSEEVLQVAGLDAYVYLRFFRMAVKILAVMSCFGIFIMSPIRYRLEGQFDSSDLDILKKKSDDPGQTDPPSYLLVCTFFTYVFTFIVFYFMFGETRHIIRTRQRFLGSQKALPDRTIMISSVPPTMRDEEALKTHIEDLGVGKVDEVYMARDYSMLKNLFDQRNMIVKKLEILYSQFYRIDVRILRKHQTPSATLKVVRQQRTPGKEDIVYTPKLDSETTSGTGYSTFLSALDKYGQFRKRPQHRLQAFGPKVDSFEYYTRGLLDVDAQIQKMKESSNFHTIGYAFVSMRNVTGAQMAAQALFSPNPFQLVTCLAPAPFDITWDNLLLSSQQLFVRRNVIETLIVIFSALLVIPIRYITSLLNVQTITKHWPKFGEYLLDHYWARTLFTGLLPTYLFSLLNTILPYFISFLCQQQGNVSKGDTELSVVKKNFLYIFFNMFLVFTLFGTISSYKALLTDTTKIAPLLAKSIKSLSLFYCDLIVLQGFTMMPFKLLQIGDIWNWFWCCLVRRSQQTPKRYRNLFYKPGIFQIGLNLPQHMFYFIIVLIYSVLSTKILVCGLVYFCLGLYVYKYQLVYSMVHPYHSTGKVWPIVFKRVCLGLFFLHLQMFGELVLENSYVPAVMIVPVFPTTLVALLYFQHNYEPLLYYIALDAVKTEGQSVEEVEEDDELQRFVKGSVHGPSGRRESVVLTDGSFDEHGHLSVPNTSVTEADVDAESDSEQQQQQPQQQQQQEDQPESGQTLEPLSRTHTRMSTIEEEREEGQSYTYPCLLDRMEGPWAGFVGDYKDLMEYRWVPESEPGLYGSLGEEQEALEQGKGRIKVTIKRQTNSINEFD